MNKFLCPKCHLIFEDEYVNGQILYNTKILVICPLCGTRWNINKS